MTPPELGIFGARMIDDAGENVDEIVLRIDDKADAHPRVVSHPQIGCDIADRIHLGAGGVAAAAKQVQMAIT